MRPYKSWSVKILVPYNKIHSPGFSPGYLLESRGPCLGCRPLVLILRLIPSYSPIRARFRQKKRISKSQNIEYSFPPLKNPTRISALITFLDQKCQMRFTNEKGNKLKSRSKIDFDQSRPAAYLYNQLFSLNNIILKKLFKSFWKNVENRVFFISFSGTYLTYDNKKIFELIFLTDSSHPI